MLVDDGRPETEDTSALEILRVQRVRRLEFRATESANVFIADSPFGIYRIYGAPGLRPQDCGPWLWSLITNYPRSGCLLAGGRDPEDVVSTPEASMAQAQADFEARFRACLEPVPAAKNATGADPGAAP